MSFVVGNNSKNQFNARRIALAVTFLFSASAFAQAPETTGSPRKPAPEAKKPAKAPIEQAPKKQSSPAAPAGGRKIKVSKFTFTGNTAYSAEQLEPLVADYLNKPITLAEVYEAADKVTAFYAANGYTLAQATVPAQKISDGAIRLEVIEGRIAGVSVEGTHFYTLEQVTDNLGTFKSGEVYRGTDLDEGLRKLNRLPGLSAKAVLQPGAAYGTSNLVVQADEKPITGSLSGDNYGRRNLGQYRTSLAVALNNPLRLEDQFQVMGMFASGGALRYGMAGYNFPLFNQGPRLALSYSQAQFETMPFPGLPLEGSNKTARAELGHSLLDTRSNQVSVAAGASYTKADADLIGTPISETEIALYDFTAVYAHVYDVLAVTQLAVTLQSNFDSQEPADCPLTGTSCEDQKLRTEVDLQHIQPLFGRLDGYVHGTYVHTDDVLPDLTQFSLGGPNSVRGYQAAEIRGDRGHLASAGLRQGFRLGPTVLHARVFGDTGQVERLGLVALTEKDSLSSWGVGADFLYAVAGMNIIAKADWSFPLDGHDESPLPGASDPRSSRLFATVAVTY